ncbi:MAG TPA: hypothetical protein VEH02_11390 [Pseudolabrys sp.]|nr:hypothetical protein [Pseudolabrys sp.]
MRSFILAAVAAAGLALVSMSGASAVPIAPIGQAATTVDARTPVYYYGYRYHHHRHCWWRHGYRVCRWW